LGLITEKRSVRTIFQGPSTCQARVRCTSCAPRMPCVYLILVLVIQCKNIIFGESSIFRCCFWNFCEFGIIWRSKLVMRWTFLSHSL